MGFLHWLLYGNSDKASSEKASASSKREEPTTEEIRQAIHEAAQGYLFVRGDEKVLPNCCFQFVIPQMTSRKNMEVLEHEASIGNPEAQWIWALRFLVGYKSESELPNPGMVGQRINNAAKQGVKAAQCYLADYFKSAGNEQAALIWLSEAARLEDETAAMITLEWKLEGYHFKQDPDALNKLLFFAKKGNVRAQWYLDSIGIDYKNDN